MKKTIAISIGDLNGIGIALALKNHEEVKQFINPLYIIDRAMLLQSSKLLNLDIPNDFNTVEPFCESFKITPSKVTKQSGKYAFESFKKAVELAQNREVEGIMTLPIHKKAWELAGVAYKGHTDALRNFFQQEAIMMLGCEAMFVALYSEHIALCQVADEVKDTVKFARFLENFYHAIRTKLKKDEQIALLGLNPHAGDDGVLGDEERALNQSIDNFNKKQAQNIYTHTLVPDVAFTPRNRAKYRFFVALYHDQGLIALKALHFDESINISLNLPIIRTSVDHGTAFDIAYSQVEPNNLSYLNALRYYL